MHRKLPPLDLIRGFESAARHLSFTKAAEELFLTQSAVSRQIQSLEEHLGAPLFHRSHRTLLLTEEGQILQRTAQGVLHDLEVAMERVNHHAQPCTVTVTTTVALASLWLVPRLPAFREQHPHIDVRIAADNTLLDLERARIDIAIRYIAQEKAPAGAAQLFSEEVLPVCSPQLMHRLPLKTPQDLRHHVLLHLDDPPGMSPYLEWDNWLAAQGLADLKPAGELRFSHYDQLITSAVGGQGVALGSMPMLRRHLSQKKLAAPFDSHLLPGRSPASSRAFFMLRSARAQRPEVDKFIAWLQQEKRNDTE